MLLLAPIPTSLLAGKHPHTTNYLLSRNTKPCHKFITLKPLKLFHFYDRRIPRDFIPLRATISSETGQGDGEVEEEEPWKSAVIFRRSHSRSDFSSQTTLEQLALNKLSFRKTNFAAEDEVENREVEGNGTPVFVMGKVEREGRGFRLEGHVKTVIGVKCRRCLGPVLEQVHSDFCLSLTPSPVAESSKKSIGVIIGESRFPTEEEDDDFEGELDLDIDDKIYFPAEQKELDLSKYIRDLIHLEIPMGAICSSNCRGLCLLCGVNLNNSKCQCRVKRAVDPRWSALEKLKESTNLSDKKNGKE